MMLSQETKIGKGRLVLAAKIGPGGLILVADLFLLQAHNLQKFILLKSILRLICWIPGVNQAAKHFHLQLHLLTYTEQVI